MASVSIKNAVKDYGVVSVLKDVSIEVEDGGMVVLVGPSGCGKSTLLRMIAGLEEITGGAIQIGDRIVNDVAPKKRDIAMVFQNYALYPHMTVAQNMAFSLRLKGMSKPEINDRINRAADVLGLSDLLSRKPRELSGGQRQRVAMGRAIVRDPQVFLFDEPLSNLDAKLRVQMRAEIKELHQRLKTTTIYVTHDQVEAMTLADKIVVMKDGVIEQIGSPLELYDRPDNVFVAGFIGSPAMNLLEGGAEGKIFKTVQGASLPMATSNPEVRTYGIRPEHFYLDDDGLEMEAVVLEPTGAETLVRGRVAGEIINVILRERIGANPGDIIKVSPDLSQVHLFDESGKRVV